MFLLVNVVPRQSMSLHHDTNHKVMKALTASPRSVESPESHVVLSVLKWLKAVAFLNQHNIPTCAPSVYMYTEKRRQHPHALQHPGALHLTTFS